LTQLPSSLSNLSKLEILDLARNNMKNLPFDPSIFSNLVNLDLSGNPWANQEEMTTLIKKLTDRGTIVKNFPIGSDWKDR
ncbi:MAG TPA: hypothetical protein VFE57_10320, partial [Cyclobacteriaceae bacterium]|nr:hypothetical protein [Cyclobacteriaceae bacterium]